MQNSTKTAQKSAQILQLGSHYLNNQGLNPIESILLKDLSKLLHLSNHQCWVLTAICHSWNLGDVCGEKEMRELHAKHISTENYTETMSVLQQRGFIEIEQARRKRHNEYFPNQGLMGFVQTGDQAFLQYCQSAGEDKLINKCLSWHMKQQNPFSSGGAEVSLIKTLMDFHDHSIVMKIIQLTSDVNEQSVLLFVLGHEILYRAPIKLKKVTDEIFDQPLSKLLHFNKWANPESELYTKGLFTVEHEFQHKVIEIRLSNAISRWLIPAELQSVKLIQNQTTQFVQVIEPRDIPTVKLYYPEDFQIEVDVFLSQLQPKKLNAYLSVLKKRGMAPNLAVMLYGLPGTGKTELVRQLAKKHNRTLLIVNLQSMRDKWFGESEKNIGYLFSEIRNLSKQMSRQPIVLFNEADGFFHQRGNSQRSHIDQTETIITAMFLNELERFEGILFATSNHTITMDKAFERRWTIKLEVPQPDSRVRLKILRDRFKGLVPYRALDILSQKLEFSAAQADNILKKFLLLNPDEEAASVLQEIIIHEIGGWTVEPKKIGFNQ